ncbi:MAG TPA: S1 RNA-binding domain-containing protein, partial [Candidatus Sulfomarinibacteraceae bacterium]|nr:S1 RNA-binding domain-containing protein [Candidatus Sulfomarinibacteraceae bacterium]
VEWKTVLFLREREGEVFAGHISGVTDFGIFVRLDEIAADGMIHLSDLTDDYYVYDERRHRLVGERNGRVWRLGDALEARLVRVDLEAMQLQLVPVDVTPDARAARKTGRPRSRSKKR